MLQKQGKKKQKKLHMFWQPATLIKGGRGFVQLFFWLIVDTRFQPNLKILLSQKWVELDTCFYPFCTLYQWNSKACQMNKAFYFGKSYQDNQEPNSDKPGFHSDNSGVISTFFL